MALTACGSRPRQGSEAVLDLFAKIFERFPVHSDRPTRLICDGGTVVAEIHFEGRSATGTDVTFEAVDVFDVVDGPHRPPHAVAGQRSPGTSVKFSGALKAGGDSHELHGARVGGGHHAR